MGEVVLFKAAKNSGDRKRVVGENWREGIWLGHNRGSSDALVGTEEGVIRAWSVKRLSEGERWSKEKIEKMQGTPGQPDPSKPGIKVPVRITMPEEAMPTATREPESVGRKVYLKEEDFMVHGYTEGCPGCIAQKSGMPARAHNGICRKRLGLELQKESNPRWIRARERGGVAEQAAEANESKPESKEDKSEQENGADKVHLTIKFIERKHSISISKYF